jgi:hypothetical protein
MFGGCGVCSGACFISDCDWFCAKALCDAGNDNNNNNSSIHNDAAVDNPSTTNRRNDDCVCRPHLIPLKQLINAIDLFVIVMLITEPYQSQQLFHYY